jgi:hypothetical protein
MKESKKIGYKWIQNGKHVIFETRKVLSFLDISSTNIDTLVPSLYQCVETRSIDVFSHFRTSVSTSSSAKRLPSGCEPFPAINTSHRKEKIFLYKYLYTESFARKKLTPEHCSGSTILKHGRHFDH